MTRNVFAKWLWDARRSLAGWTVAIVVVGGIYAVFWPIIDDPELQKVLENYPQAMLEALNYTDFASPEGYLSATVYGLLVALLLLVRAVSAGARLIAGDEESGTLDLVLAHPVSRSSVALQRFAAYAVSVLVILAVFWVAMVALLGPAQLDGVSPGDLAAMHVHAFAYALLFGALTFGVGAATGRRGLALVVGSAVGVLAYAARGLIPQVEGLEWVEQYSAFTWLTGSEPLRNGIDAGHVGLMLGLSILMVGVGILLFQRRDVAA